MKKETKNYYCITLVLSEQFQTNLLLAQLFLCLIVTSFVSAEVVQLMLFSLDHFSEGGISYLQFSGHTLYNTNPFIHKSSSVSCLVLGMKSRIRQTHKIVYLDL